MTAEDLFLKTYIDEKDKCKLFNDTVYMFANNRIFNIMLYDIENNTYLLVFQDYTLYLCKGTDLITI